MIKPILTLARRNLPLVLILLVVAILRFPTFFEPYWYGDEAITLTVGRALRVGWTLYQDIQDNKTPFLYYVALLSYSLFWFKINLFWWHFVSVIAFWGLTTELGHFLKPHQRATFKISRILAVSLFSLFTTIPLWEGNLVNGEIFMIGPTIGGMWLVINQARSRHISVIKLVAAGICFAAAFLFKHPAATDFAAALLFLLFSVQKFNSLNNKKLIKQWMFIGLGFAILLSVILLNFVSKNALGDFFNSVFSQNFSYLGSWSSGQPVHQVDEVGSSGLVVRAAILFIVTNFLWFARKRFTPLGIFLLLWLSYALFGALLSGRPYAHYLLQVVPALSLLLGFLPFLMKQKLQLLSTFIAMAVFVFSYIQMGFWTYPVTDYYLNFFQYISGQKNMHQYYSSFDNETLPIYQLTNEINRQLPKDKTLYMWGNQAGVYLLTNTLPPMKYIMAYHVDDFNGYDLVMAQLHQHPPLFIVTTKEPFPELQQFIDSNYHLHHSVNSFTMYKHQAAL